MIDWPLGPKLEAVRRIAVVRGGGLGDLLFALPALRALEAAYPDAEMVLLGSRIAAELFEGRPGAPDRVFVLPPARGVGVGDTVDTDASASARETEQFLEARRAERYDLAAQMHGGGFFSNPFTRALGARCTIGTRSEEASELDRSIHYAVEQHEMLRWLEVAGLVGAALVELEPRLAATPRELARARSEFAWDGPRIVVHPGATDSRRRWPIAQFAEVVAALVSEGASAVIVGSASERTLCAKLHAETLSRLDARNAKRVIDSSGTLHLSELVGLLAAADVMIGNDSGPRHLAQALGTKTASIFWCGNLVNAGPMTRAQHRVQVSWTLACPICGRTAAPWGGGNECAHDAPLVASVASDAVLDDARALLSC